MDTSFEGGGPMPIQSTITQINTPGVQPQSMQSLVEMSENQEIVLGRKTETDLVDVQAKTEVVQSKTNQDVADQLLSDSKEIGIGSVLEKLASGGYRDKKVEEIDTHLLDRQIGEEVEDKNPTFDERKKEILSYVVEQSSSDPLMQQKLGEVASEMIANGQDIDPDLLQEEAIRRYSQEKEKGESISLEEKVLSIEEQFAQLLSENDELRAQLQEFKDLVKQQSDTMQTMALALLELAKKLHKEKEEEKEKKSLLELLILLMGAFLQEMSSPADDKKNQNVKLPDLSQLAILSKDENKK